MTDQNPDLVNDLKNKIATLEQENSQLKQNQVDVNKAKELYLSILEEFPALIWRANTDKLCDYFNSTWLEFTGRTMEQEYGNGWAEGVHPDDLEKCFEIYTSNFDQRKPFSMEYRLKNRLGEYRWILDIGRPYYDFDDTFLGYIGSCYDITDNKRNEEQLKKLATTDKLTQLSNRFKLDSTLELEISRAQRYHSNLSIILVDIDDFKNVNDNFGHLVGDQVIIHVAKILKENTRASDTVGRWGGEEFLIICPETDSEAATAIAEKLRTAIAGHKFPKITSKTCSFGITTYQNGDDTIQLLKRADQALYISKNSGKNQTQIILG